MKNIITTIFVLGFTALGFSQVIIGDDIGTISAGNKQGVLLEFAKNQNKGIILPYNRTLPTGPGLVGGTITVDATDVTKVKVVYYNDASWVDLSSGNQAEITTALGKQPVVSAVPEATTKGAIIGSSTSSADGILILESTNKAMVLPQVATTDDIINPAPGMMVYVSKVGAQRLAVFNGAKWTFWMP